MDEYVGKTLFAVAGIIWSVIQITMGFLYKYWFDRNEKDKEDMKKDIKENKHIVENRLEVMIKDFQSGVDSLRSAVGEMKELVSVIRVQHSTEIAEINRRLERKKEWLEDHDEIISRHDRELTEVKSNCNHYHK